MDPKNRIKHSLIAAIIFIVSLGFFCGPAFAGDGDSDVYIMLQDFTWKEFIGGEQILEESGYLYGFGVSRKTVYEESSVTSKLKGELFTGTVDYDGETNSVPPIAVQTDTEYFGFKVEWDIGRQFMVSEKSSLEPFIGLGYRWWQRDINTTSMATGYEESWRNVYARLGIRGDLPVSDELEVFAEGGIKRSIHTQNEVDLAFLGVTKVEVEPGNDEALFAEAGLKWNRVKVSVFYEEMRFKESGKVTACGYPWCVIGAYQPESEADIYGVNVGMSF